MSNKKIEISYKTIVFTVLFLIGLFVLWQVRALIILMFISFIFMEVLNPAIVKLEKYKIPRPLAILIVYLIIIAIVSLTIAGIVPILVQQTSDLIKTLPETLEDINIFGTNAIDWSSQLKVLENLPSSIAKTAVSLVSNIMSGFVIMFLTFYMLLGLNYAVPLAIFAGLLEAIPSIGPTVTTIVASLVGFTTSPLTGFLTIGFGIIIQQLENNIIVPKVMKQTVGFNPLVTILLIAAGAKLGGVVGAILALPIFLTIQTVFEVLIPRKNK